MFFLQAIAIACCFHDEGPILVVCPAVLRFSWAEELEHWLPFLLPKDIHLGTFLITCQELLIIFNLKVKFVGDFV